MQQNFNRAIQTKFDLIKFLFLITFGNIALIYFINFLSTFTVTNQTISALTILTMLILFNSMTVWALIFDYNDQSAEIVIDISKITIYYFYRRKLYSTEIYEKKYL